MQVEACLCGGSDQRDDNLSFKAAVAQLDINLPKLLVMMREDFEMLNSGEYKASASPLANG